MITEVVGKEIEKIKGDFESYLNGLNMVGKISYSQYSELYDEGIKQIQKAYELGKSELEKENAELKRDKQNLRADLRTARNNLQAKDTVYQLAMEENAELKQKYDIYLRENTGLKIHSAYVEKKLTKAKEIIRELLTCARNYPESNKQKMQKAEQFLKEEKK